MKPAIKYCHRCGKRVGRKFVTLDGGTGYMHARCFSEFLRTGRV